MRPLADFLQVAQRQSDLPAALLIFEGPVLTSEQEAFRTRAVGGNAKLSSQPDAHFQWIRKRASGVFSDLIGVGRTRNNDIVLPAEGVSKYHAYFRRDEDGKFEIADADSKNGTKLNGESLAPRVPVAVQDGDRITFATTEAVFRTTESVLAQLAP